MISLVRIVGGLSAAIVASALIKVGHVITPGELVGLTPDVFLSRMARLLELVALTATHQGLFILLFAPIAIGVAELNRIRSVSYYLVVGIAIAAAGFYLQFVGEGVQRTIVNAYAAQAYIVEGVLAGLVYWLIAGRFAGWRRGGGLVKATPYPLGKPRLNVSDAVVTEGGPAARA
jgi:hypothetical protein